MPKLSRHQRHQILLLRKRFRSTYFCTWCRRKHRRKSKIGRKHMKFKGVRVTNKSLFFCPRDGMLLRRHMKVEQLSCPRPGCSFRGKYVRRGRRILLKEVRN